MSQNDIARRLGVSAALVTKYKKRGMPVHSAEAAAAWRAANIGSYTRADAYQPPAAPGPSGQDKPEQGLAAERARLAAAQADYWEARNAVQRGEFASIGLLSQVLAAASAAIAERLDGLKPLLRREFPDAPLQLIERIDALIGQARNEWVRSTAELVAAKLEEVDADPVPAGSP